ncbi:ABC transporter ATP-binding protein [Agrococcus citreus]|uniref:ATP-binding cassette domain-containing protein n=1 Tax=Agrococcus citreus TaxID=84643 RepID=A0ABP4JH00_9MICO
MSAAIEVAALHARFAGRTVLDDVSFTVPWGAVTGFIGVNGAGKTTTLRRIVGLDGRQGAPRAGIARVAGRAFEQLVDPCSVLGYCPDALGAAPGQSAAQHLEALALRARLGRDATRRALDDVGLTGATGRIRSFSLGMRRRLAIAGALLGAPRVLVLDEPFDGLDPAGRRWLSERLREHADRGGAVLLSAHALDEIEPLLDRVVCLHDGRVRFEGDTEAFLRSHAARVVLVRSLDQPRLAAALGAHGATVHARAGGAIAVRGLEALEIARVGAAVDVLVTELTPRRTTLSAAFGAAIEELR